MRTVFWEADQLKLIDQRRLPASLEVIGFSRAEDVAEAIRDMVVRGAPAIGVSAAFGLALAARQSRGATTSEVFLDLETASARLRSARPTAVNLGWALDQMLRSARSFRGSASCSSISISLY